MRIFRYFAAVFVMLLAAASLPASARPALVIDADSGEVLHSHEATRLWYPASVTKVMTTYVALSAVRGGKISMNSALTVTQRALNEPPSKTGMPVGSSLTLEAALRILMVKSANDTAVTVAEGVGGSVEGFVTEMNRTAARLGMRDTHYANPNGLPDAGQITTARDQAILARAIYDDFPSYRYLFSLESVKIGKRTVRNHNSLIGRYPGADGLKTGFICDSGFNLVASARRDGRHLIAVVFGAENVSEREDVVVSLLEAGFNTGRAGIFGSRRANVESLPSTRLQPFVMRDSVCGPRKQRQPVPAQIASYGVSSRVASATIKTDPSRSTTAGTSGPGLLAALASRGSDQPVAAGDTDDDPVSIARVPLPTPNPRRR
ncbi:MAG: D-alanyl-D-alanine carboxypeptidase family protein [Flavobacteriaceae bacterium]